MRDWQYPFHAHLRGGIRHINNTDRLFRCIRELYFYGDIPLHTFLRYMGMARSEDYEMYHLMTLLIKNYKHVKL